MGETFGVDKLFGEECDQRFFEQLSAAALKIGGTDEAVARSISADVVRLEILKRKFQEDIEKRGVSREVSNGRQHYLKDNASCSGMLKAIDAQRKLLGMLGLISDKGQPQTDDDGFDEI